MSNNNKNIYFRCDDNAETIVFTRYDWNFKNENETDYSFSIEDSYCGGDYMGIKGRIKRAWHAFWAKPIYHSSVYCEGTGRMKEFLNKCLALMEEDSSQKE